MPFCMLGCDTRQNVADPGLLILLNTFTAVVGVKVAAG
jgi:hypothetical protein